MPRPLPHARQLHFTAVWPDRLSEQRDQIMAVLADFSEGLAFVKDDKGEKVAIDESGRVQFAAPYDVILPYHHGLAEYQRKVSHFNWGGFLAGALIGSSRIR